MINYKYKYPKYIFQRITRKTRMFFNLDNFTFECYIAILCLKYINEKKYLTKNQNVLRNFMLFRVRLLAKHILNI